MNAPRTEIIHGSQMPELVRRIFEIRDPQAFPKYRKALARWERRAKGKEIHVRKGRDSLFGNEPIGTFFKARAYGEDVEVFKPEPPGFVAYSHMRYRRFGDMAFPASDRGLFANATYNREMRPQRVVQYAQAMVLGEWRDLLSDAIAITADGHVVNGQHRIAAAADAWGGSYEVDSRTAYPPNDPAFLVIWGVDPSEAIHADASRRTQKDERTIAEKLLTGKEVDAKASTQ
jgi:hypothetical protein